jgi:5-methylcytosine-specific restriction endonuclease McrA
VSERIHRLTHPVLGPASWSEIQKAAKKRRAESGRLICSWCFGEVPSGARTRCGSAHCAEMLLRVQSSWGHCAHVALRAAKGLCALCGRRGGETDHIHPVSLGGLGDAENLRVLCSSCHQVETTRLRRLGAAYVARTSITDPIEHRPTRRRTPKRKAYWTIWSFLKFDCSP